MSFSTPENAQITNIVNSSILYKLRIFHVQASSHEMWSFNGKIILITATECIMHYVTKLFLNDLNRGFARL